MIHSTSRLSRGARLRRRNLPWTISLAALLLLALAGGVWAIALASGHGEGGLVPILSRIFKR